MANTPSTPAGETTAAKNAGPVVPKADPALEKMKAAQDDAAAKQAAADAQQKPAPEKEDKGSPELQAAANAEADRIINSNIGANKAKSPNTAKAEAADAPHNAGREAAYAEARTAGEKLRLIALSYPLTTPDEHRIFGFGGHVFTLGDLRNLMNIRQR